MIDIEATSGTLLVITYTWAARQSLRNVCRAHEDSVVRWFGRAALFESTEFGAFQALQAKHDLDVQVERVEPFVESDMPERIREAASTYENRDQPSVPYRQFTSGTDPHRARVISGD